MAAFSKFRRARLRLANVLAPLALLLMALGALAWWYTQLPLARALAIDHVNEPLTETERVVLVLTIGAGRLQLGAGSGEQMLSGRVETLRGLERLTRTVRAQDGVMVYRLMSDAPAAIREPARWPKWNLNVNPNVPLELDVRGGLGPSELDLRGLNVTRFELEAAAARPTVLFPDEGRLDAVVNGGSGRVTLVVPRSVALGLVAQPRGAGHIELDGRVYRRDATYTSPDYAAADARLNLVVTSRSAQVIIERR